MPWANGAPSGKYSISFPVEPGQEQQVETWEIPSYLGDDPVKALYQLLHLEATPVEVEVMPVETQAVTVAVVADEEDIISELETEIIEKLRRQSSSKLTPRNIQQGSRKLKKYQVATVKVELERLAALGKIKVSERTKGGKNSGVETVYHLK